MEVNWFSIYRVHHRVAEHFRVDRAFILGDAAHIHSPAGGQGMNTGIGDAVNLGWKLADVLHGRSSVAMLDSFEEERIVFARQLVATTDRAFTAIVRGGALGRLTREFLMPWTVALATHQRFVRHLFFRTVSQTAIHYPNSMLSEGRAGGIRGGDRLPWVAACDNFAALQSLDWQVHIFGATGRRRGRFLPAHRHRVASLRVEYGRGRCRLRARRRRISCGPTVTSPSRPKPRRRASPGNLRHQIPSSALTSSDAIVCGSHGGVNVISTFAFLTPSIAEHAILHRLHEHRTHRTHRRGERHHHADVLTVFSFGGDVVDETELEDSQVQFGVFHLDECFAHLLDGWHADEVRATRQSRKTPAETKLRHGRFELL